MAYCAQLRVDRRVVAVNRALTNQRETKYVRGLEKMMEQPAVPANVVRLFA